MEEGGREGGERSRGREGGRGGRGEGEREGEVGRVVNSSPPQMRYQKVQKLQQLKDKAAEKSEDKDTDILITNTLQLIDTTLLKCYIKVGVACGCGQLWMGVLYSKQSSRPKTFMKGSPVSIVFSKAKLHLIRDSPVHVSRAKNISLLFILMEE